jgi:hypothetical protein
MPVWLAAGGLIVSRDRDEVEKSVDGLRDHARVFYRADLRAPNDDRPRGEERADAPSRARVAAAGLTGAIDRRNRCSSG